MKTSKRLAKKQFFPKVYKLSTIIRKNTMWHSSTDTPPPTKKFNSRCTNLSYLSSGLVVSLCRRDIISALVSAGCHHLAIKIFNYLDSSSLLASSLVCNDWQAMLLGSIYTTSKFRKRVRNAIFEGNANTSQIVFSLDMDTSAAVVDVAIDDDFNIFALGVLAGRPHVMACSLFGLGKKRWVHRFSENLDMTKLACISAGQSLVAIGCKDGRIHLYECNQLFRSLRLTAILAHHTRSIRSIVFTDNRQIVSCSDDMTIGIVSILSNGSLQLTKLLHGHVSRVRAIDVQNGKIISGSDDRSVKLWSIKGEISSSNTGVERPLTTMTGHSGPVTNVQLSLPYALSSAGSTVRLWNVDQGTCLKLLQHEEEAPVTTMAWISTFKGVATVDSFGTLRCFDLYHLETANQEIVVASSLSQLHDKTTSLTSSPTQSIRNKRNEDPQVSSSWPENAIIKLESIPHHFSAFSLSNDPLPKITVHCLDYVL